MWWFVSLLYYFSVFTTKFGEKQSSQYNSDEKTVEWDVKKMGGRSEETITFRVSVFFFFFSVMINWRLKMLYKLMFIVAYLYSEQLFQFIASVFRISTNIKIFASIDSISTEKLSKCIKIYSK